MKVTPDIRRALQDYLESQGLTAEALADRMGLSNSTVSRWVSTRGVREIRPAHWAKLRPLLAPYLDAHVLRQLAALPDDGRLLASVARDIQRETAAARQAAGPELEQIREAIRQARRDRDTLDRAMLDGLITAETAGHFNARLGGLILELDRLQARAAALEAEQEAARTPVRAVDLQTHLGRIAKRLASPDPAKQASAIREVLLGVERQEDGGYQLRTVLVPRGADTRQVWHPTREPSATLLPLLMA